jgi:signal transduction histidine kinase/CheY-like chemotaxis protein
MTKEPKNSSKFQIGNKVIIGFVLAAVLVVGVSIITFYSIQKLLSTVENLTEPNEKLRQLNGLMADVYLLDMSKTERTSDKDSVLEDTERRIKERLDWLKKYADDSLEIQSFEKISMDLSELLVVYAGLEEVRYNLTARTFSEEALVNIERRIKRQQELSEMQFLGRVRNRDFLTEITLPEKRDDTLKLTSEKLELDKDFVDIIKELGEQDSRLEEGSKITPRPETTDAALEALKTFMTKMYQDEQRLRQNFVILETRLINKNKEVFYEIQQLISSMQRELIGEYKAKNDTAYELTYTVSIVLAVMVFLGVVGSMGFVTSILTEIKKGVEYRSRLEEAKQKSDDLAKAKQDFLANMSHEIRNPLHVIQGYQEALRNLTTDQKQLEYLKMMGFASDNLVKIVNDILDFSKLEAGKIAIEKAGFDPSVLFTSIRDFYKHQADEKQLEFRWIMDFPNNNWLVSDQLRISQIMTNLLSNALKFTSQGFVQATITLESNQWLILEVEDSGMGMTAAVQKTLFQEFQQGDSSITRQYGGTGLGLAITKRLIDLLGGEINFRSTFQQGTVFRVTLPIALENAQVNPVNTPKEENQLSFEGFTVLLVDDDPIGLKLLKSILESKGAKVYAYPGGIQFMKDFDFKASLDVALVDIQMPQISGIEVLHQLRRMDGYQHLPILAMTANVFVEEKRQLSEEGFDGLIMKPFSQSQIFNHLSVLGIGTKILYPSKQHVQESPPSEVYSIVDVEKFCLGDKELVIEIMGDIIQTTEQDLNSIQQAFKTLDYLKIREITHQLSSRLRQIRVSAGELAKEIEVSIKIGKYDTLEKDLAQLEVEIREVIALLKHDFS